MTPDVHWNFTDSSDLDDDPADTVTASANADRQLCDICREPTSDGDICVRCALEEQEREAGFR